MDKLPVTPLTMGERVEFDSAVLALRQRMMFRDPKFVLDNWDCKYIDARIDMRTGAVWLKPGNDRAASDSQATSQPI